MWFKRKNKQINIESITCGERDEHGFADTYVNGNKTNVRILVFTEEEIKRLQESILKK